jgi:hypothetical protein
LIGVAAMTGFLRLKPRRIALILSWRQRQPRAVIGTRVILPRR